MGKVKKTKEKPGVAQEEASVVPPAVRQSDDPVDTKRKWINKQRVLVFASRGINHRDRHLMEDIKKLMPHHKPEAKMERSKTLSVINEMCEMKNCNKAVMFEGRKKRDLYLWLSNTPNGPSVKFLVQNVYTMEELKLTGNCLRGSRPILSFDPVFTEKPHYSLLKELLTQTFGVPRHHPKSQPFFDHVYTFTVLDNRIWFRNFQILSEDGALAEVGPRFVLNPVKIFSGSFGGVALWENASYMSPARYRNQVRIAAKNKYVNRIQQKVHAEATRPTESYKMRPLDDIFQGNPLDKAQEYKKQEVENEEAQTAIIKEVKNKKKKKLKGITKENGTNTGKTLLKKIKQNKKANDGNLVKTKKSSNSIVKAKNKINKGKKGKIGIKVKINGLAKKSPQK
ncbi:ribosome biogenesis protein BRX1 homolog [Diabrotica virgifera virgifera]|uniref:Ribosome biogenesis protein BRX1 homolog n=1 Tax=Diabrotica virgifera virgifera TaxID=50390 RepID=A0ABM5INT8_DIAVI|nr:ribosome biogenesis protein BRX1 homolog [Diabrotica virgifera virgifera]